jgi:hypothetical protein
MTPAELAALVRRQPPVPERDQNIRMELFLCRLYRKPKAPRKRA